MSAPMESARSVYLTGAFVVLVFLLLYVVSAA